MDNITSTIKEAITRDLMMLWFFMGQQRRGGHGAGFGPANRPGHQGHPGHRGSNDRPAPLDPTRGRGRIIAMLKIKDGLSAKELAQVLGIRVSSLNETLAKMEKDGLIERRPSDADKRVILVYLTEDGNALEVADHDDVNMLDGFSDEELEQLSAYLSRMLKNVESDLDEDFVASMRAAWEARAQFMASGDARFEGGPGMFWGGGPRGFGHGPFPFRPDMSDGHNSASALFPFREAMAMEFGFCPDRPRS